MRHNDRLKIAIQKSGRLNEGSLALLNAIGIELQIRDRLLIAHAINQPIDLLRVRDDDIPGLVMEGVVDLGFVGENELEEQMLARQVVGKSHEYKTLRRLNYGACRLSIAVPEEMHYQDVTSLNGMSVATTYPYLLERFFAKHNIQADAVCLTGSVEVAPRAGLASAICDLVGTGATLEANGLVEQEIIFNSQAVLIQHAAAPLASPKQALVEQMLCRMDGVMQAKARKYITLHAERNKLEQVQALLPGAENPTVIPLAGSDTRVAIHAVSAENVFWETMESLKALGCSSILVMPIEKMMA